jgi:hypothetical protein
MLIMILFMDTKRFTIKNISGSEYSVAYKHLNEVKKLPVIENKKSYSVFNIPGNVEYSKLYVVEGTNINVNISNSGIHFSTPIDFSINEPISEIVMWISHRWTLQINGEETKCQDENEYNHIEIKSIKIHVKGVRSGDLGRFIEGIPGKFHHEFNKLKGS